VVNFGRFFTCLWIEAEFWQSSEMLKNYANQAPERKGRINNKNSGN
jgi:hypothetical protein